MKKKIIAIIPARGGSKRVKNKNIRLLNKKPLINYTIQEALKSKFIDEIVVTSDSEKILDIAKKFKSIHLVKRSKKLSNDSAQSFPVIKDAIKKIQNTRKINFDFFIMLQPTSPFRKVKDIDYCLKKLILKKNFESIVSVVDVGGSHPLRMKKIIKNKLVNYIEQERENMKPIAKLPKVYLRNGAIYASKINVLNTYKALVGKKVIPYVMIPELSINIDEEVDFILAELFYKNKHSKI